MACLFSDKLRPTGQLRRPSTCCRRPTMTSMASSTRLPRRSAGHLQRRHRLCRNPNVMYNGGADITLTPSLVATTRFGYWAIDDLPELAVCRWAFATFTGTPTTPTPPANAPALASTHGAERSDVAAGPQFVNSTGYSNIGANSATVFDRWRRYNFNQDLAVFQEGHSEPTTSNSATGSCTARNEWSTATTPRMFMWRTTLNMCRNSPTAPPLQIDRGAEHVTLRTSRAAMPTAPAAQG